MKSKTSNKQLWFEFINKNVCGLCGNSGFIDTRGVKNPLGVECGIRSFCICPNGRVFKKQKEVFSTGHESVMERVLAFIESQKKELEMQSDGEYHFVNNAKVASHNHALGLVEKFIKDNE